MAKYVDGAGLARFWDNIKDSIGTASQEQVDAWLDDHPEATTTVQDGAITTPKLASGAVTEGKLDSVVAAKLGGVPMGTRTGIVASVPDCAGGMPMAVTVYGSSKQDGTPSISVPVAIESVDSLELHASASGTSDATGWPVTIGLQGYELRSLPNGTRDEVSVDAWGNVTLTQRVGSATLGSSANIGTSFVNSTTMNGNCTRVTFDGSNFPGLGRVALSSQNSACSHASYGQTGAAAAPSPGVYSKNTTSGVYLTLSASLTSGSEALAWLGQNPVTLIYPLDAPVTYDLGTVSLPELPAPDLVAWTVDSTTLSLTYLRDASTALTILASSIAPIEDGVASTNYAVGSYLVRNGRLYRVTTAIATGEAITPGTNVTATTVMAEVLSLTA